MKCKMTVIAAQLVIAGLFSAATTHAASPSAASALKLVPVQKGIDFDRPTAAEAEKCKIEARKIGGKVGWMVEDPGGLPLRRFVDTNGDNVVDQWCYYKDGLEVYRDIDADFNGKADQYRWFNTAGTRWGLDTNEDGEIDAWKSISAEEVSSEIIAALARRDSARFARLMLRPSELANLGLGKEKADEVAKKIANLAADFNALASRQKAIPATAQWVQFNCTQPGIVPAGTDGSTKDLKAYENALAIIETDDGHGQVQIGTLVKSGDAWRVVDLPRIAGDAQASSEPSGLFFQASLVSREPAATPDTDTKAQELLAALEKLDSATPSPENNAKRADLIEKIAASAATEADRKMWIKQMADMISAAVQSGTYPDGADRLEKLLAKLGDDKELAAYVKFRQMTAAYGLSLQKPDADYAKIQEAWIASLEKYIEDYPKLADTAEAMLQLAINQEFGGKDEEANKWYGRLVAEYPGTPAATKAAGARTRLGCVGKTISVSGTSTTGSKIDLADHKGRVVLIQYWASWCQPAKNDMPLLKELKTKYGKSFSIIGVNLDSNRKAAEAYLAEERLPWPQIYEPGGLDSRPANQLGILTLPTMILVGSDGKVVSRNIQAGELPEKLKELVK